MMILLKFIQTFSNRFSIEIKIKISRTWAVEFHLEYNQLNNFQGFGLFLLLFQLESPFILMRNCYITH